MLSEAMLVEKVSAALGALRGKPPYEATPVLLTTGELVTLLNSLALLTAVRAATK